MTDSRSLFERYLRQRGPLGADEYILPSGTLDLLRRGPKAKPEAIADAGIVEPPAGSQIAGPAVQPVSPAVAARLTTIVELGAVASVCVSCQLSATRTQVVFGDGDPQADLVVVGEAPGADEDKIGRPFVGRAGRLLDALLLSIGFPREKVYICNVLKCRPPGTRNPTPAEVQTCSPYLRRQIDLIGPRAILAVGTFPAQTLLESKESIGRLRGSIHEYHGVPLVPTYHPAALLRNSGWVRPVWEDLQRLRTIIDS